MTWNDYVANVEYRGTQKLDVAFKVHATSTKHALRKVTRMHPDAAVHMVELCRCSEVNNDMCEACYKL